MTNTSTGAAFMTKTLGTASWMKTFEKCVPGPLSSLTNTSTGAAFRTKVVGTASWMMTFEKCVLGRLN